MRRDSDFPIGARITIDQLQLDPHTHLAVLRQQEPVSWLPVFNGWLVTARDLAIDVMRDYETYTVDDPRFSTAQVIGPSMLSLDGVEHGRHRVPFIDQFRMSAVRSQFEGRIRARAQTLARDLAKYRRGDLRSQYGAPLAVAVMTDVLSLKGISVASLLGIYDKIVEAVDAVTRGGMVPASAAIAYEELKRAVENSMSSRQQSLPSLVQKSSDLDTDEIVSNVAVLLFGGIVTADGTTATLLQQLLINPDQMAAVADDRSLIPRAVEEALRFEPAASVVDRYTTADTLLDNTAIAKGDLVRISLSASNRDPNVFPNPDRFDIHRPNANQHLAFARGPHACLGLHLARVETAIALDVLLDELPGLVIDDDASRGPDGLVFRAPGAVGARW